MPQIQSQKKRVKTNNKRNLAVSAQKSALRTSIKKVLAAVDAKDAAAAAAAYNEASTKLDKAVAKGIDVYKRQVYSCTCVVYGASSFSSCSSCLLFNALGVPPPIYTVSTETCASFSCSSHSTAISHWSACLLYTSRCV